MTGMIDQSQCDHVAMSSTGRSCYASEYRVTLVTVFHACQDGLSRPTMQELHEPGIFFCVVDVSESGHSVSNVSCEDVKPLCQGSHFQSHQLITRARCVNEVSHRPERAFPIR